MPLLRAVPVLLSAGERRLFSWKFTASDLHDLMDRISRHEQHDNPQDKPLPEAA